MRTISITFIVSESGIIEAATAADDATYTLTDLPTSYEDPSLDQHDTSESWRAALGQHAVKLATELMGRAPHGEHLAYVSKGCHVYLYEVDFDQSV